jgi:hypothetical protein
LDQDGQPGGDRLQTAILRVGATGLEGHHERLAGGVLDGVRHLEDARVDPPQDLGGHAGAALRTDGTPGRDGGPGRRDQGERVGPGIADGELDAVGRVLGRHRADGAGHVDRELFAEQAGEGALAGGRGVLAVDRFAGRLGIGGPVVPGGGCRDRPLEQLSVGGVEVSGCGHQGSLRCDRRPLLFTNQSVGNSSPQPTPVARPAPRARWVRPACDGLRTITTSDDQGTQQEQ